MSLAAWPDHLLSLQDWEALPEDTSRRYELAEGVLHVSPRPVSDHQWALMELGYQLRGQLPDDLGVLPEVEVVLFEQWPATVRIPDLVVVPRSTARESPARYRAEDILLAVEVISPGSVGTDRVTKFAEYARAGIVDYWIVDLEQPASTAAHTLKNGHYIAVGESADKLTVRSPATMVLDPSGLLPGR